MSRFDSFSILDADASRTVINLKENIKYVMLLDSNTGTWCAKICSINNKHTAKPANKTTAMLLYLLSQDERYGILLEDFIRLVQSKFTVDEITIRGFLDTIDNAPFGWLEINRAYPDPKPDPAKLFTGTKEEWGGFDIAWGDPPISGKNNVFNTGNTVIAWIAPRPWP